MATDRNEDVFGENIDPREVNVKTKFAPGTKVIIKPSLRHRRDTVTVYTVITSKVQSISRPDCDEERITSYLVTDDSLSEAERYEIWVGEAILAELESFGISKFKKDDCVRVSAAGGTRSKVLAIVPVVEYGSHNYERESFTWLDVGSEAVVTSTYVRNDEWWVRLFTYTRIFIVEVPERDLERSAYESPG